MSTAIQGRSPVDDSHGSHPVVSTRYDKKLIEWATARLKIKKAELVKRALDDFIAKLLRDAA